MKTNPLRLIVVSLVIVFSFGIFTFPAIAKKGNNTNLFRPGWGFGDLNHIHTGPPGQSVNIVQTNNANISNSVTVNSNTGGNTSNGNIGNTTVTSGDSNVNVSIRNRVNRNVVR